MTLYKVLGRRRTVDPAIRFWSKVVRGDDNECWPWTAGTGRGRYGTFWWNGRSVRASHVALFLTTGVWPAAFVLHSCDNPPCVNPGHLRVGTHADNMSDAVMRGRLRSNLPLVPLSGEAHPNSKLTTAQVDEIRLRYACGERQIPLAAAFGVSQANVSLIVRGEAWKA